MPGAGRSASSDQGAGAQARTAQHQQPQHMVRDFYDFEGGGKGRDGAECGVRNETPAACL